jgi:hypothetical protein
MKEDKILVSFNRMCIYHMTISPPYHKNKDWPSHVAQFHSKVGDNSHLFFSEESPAQFFFWHENGKTPGTGFSGVSGLQ